MIAPFLSKVHLVELLDDLKSLTVNVLSMHKMCLVVLIYSDESFEHIFSLQFATLPHHVRRCLLLDVVILMEIIDLDYADQLKESLFRILIIWVSMT